MRNPQAPFGVPAGIGLQFVRPKPFKTGPFTIMGLSEDGTARKSGVLKIGDVIHEVMSASSAGIFSARSSASAWPSTLVAAATVFSRRPPLIRALIIRM